MHLLRSTEAAILVGAGTVWADNPSLSTRSWYGKSPLRVIIDPRLSTRKDFKVWNDEVPTLFIADRDYKGVRHFGQRTEVACIDFGGEVLAAALQGALRARGTKPNSRGRGAYASAVHQS